MTMKPLTGSSLVAKVNELGHLSKTEIAIACGYYRVVGGKPKVHFSDFYTALVDSRGIVLEPSAPLEDPWF